MRIKTYNEVNLADVQALLANTRGHQSVISSLTKPLDNLEMKRNVDNLSSCFERFHVSATLPPKNSGNWILPYQPALLGETISDPGRNRFKCLRFHLDEHETKYRISTTRAFSICFHLSTPTCFLMRFYAYRPH